MSWFVVTAGHVLVDYCQHTLHVPGGVATLGAPVGTTSRRVVALPSSAIRPDRLDKPGASVVDIVVASVPRTLTSASWPTGFNGGLAQEVALDKGMKCFVWCERGDCSRRMVRVAARLEDRVSTLDFHKCDNFTWRYRDLWSYRFDSRQAIGGDSGAPVFVIGQSKEGGPELFLLGFHVLLSESGLGHAEDAQSVLVNLVTPGVGQSLRDLIWTG